MLVQELSKLTMMPPKKMILDELKMRGSLATTTVALGKIGLVCWEVRLKS
jgi:hypothetical protein